MTKYRNSKIIRIRTGRILSKIRSRIDNMIYGIFSLIFEFFIISERIFDAEFSL
jgi:hypothetical protein